MILEFAQKVQNIDKSDADKNALHKATSKARDAETAKRKMEVTVNETRAEMMNIKSLLKNWTAASAEIFHEMNAFDTAMTAVHDDVMARLPDLGRQSNVVANSKIKADEAKSRIETKNEVIRSQHFKITNLKRKVESLTKENEEQKEKIGELEEQMDKAIEEIVGPLRLEVATANANLMKEKAIRTEDRIELADLWPPGWLMPSVLMKFKTLDPAQKAAKRQKALKLDSERALKEEIRAAVVEAGKWSEQYDEYGQIFYQHADTLETAWEQPAAMSYVPPPGRDQMGNKILETANNPAIDEDEDDEVAEELANWEQVTDQWGQVYFTNSVTGETSWEAPEGFVVDPTAAGGVDPKVAATDAARTVISYMKNRQPEVDEDGNEEELVYDIQELEEIAAGADGWKYKKPGDDIVDDNEDGQSLATKASSAAENPAESLSMEELRELVYGAATTEADLEDDLRKSRKRLGKLSHRLLEKKKIADREEEEAKAEQKKIEVEEAAAAAKAMQAKATESDSEFEISEDEEDGAERASMPQTDMDIIKAEMKEVKRRAAEREAKEEAKGGTTDVSSTGQVSPETFKPDGEAPISPENEIPPPKMSALDRKIEQLKDEHSDAEDMESDEKPSASSTTASISQELEEIIADRAAPHGKIKNVTVQALAIQAVWAGFVDSSVKVPPKRFIKESDASKWGTAAFFATLDESLIEDAALDTKASSKGLGHEIDCNDANDKRSKIPLPDVMHTRERRRKFRDEAEHKRNTFTQRALEVANTEAHNELQSVTDKMFSREMMGTELSASSAETDDPNKLVQSDITKQFKQSTKAMSQGNASQVDQLKDPTPGAVFPDPAGDVIRIADQTAERSERIHAIKKRDKAELETPWLLEQPSNNNDNQKASESSSQHEAAGSQKEQQQVDQLLHNEDDGGSSDDGIQEEKKSASPRMSPSDAPNEMPRVSDAKNTSGSASFHTSLHPPPAPALLLLQSAAVSEEEEMQGGIDEVDGVRLIKEEAIVHDRALRPLLEAAEKFRDAVWSDHFDIASFWQEQIANSEEAKKKVSKAIMEAQATIASMEGNLKGLGIAASKPKPPKAPPKLSLVIPPRNISVGDDSVEEEAPLLINGPDFQTLLTDVHNGVYNGKSVILPNGTLVTEAQKNTLLKAIKTKNESMTVEAETLTQQYEEKFTKFQASEADYAEKEAERAGSYDKMRYNLRILNLKAEHMHQERESIDKSIERFKVEAMMEEKREEQLKEADGRAETIRAKQVMEHYRGPEVIAHLQDQLCLALEQRTRALELPQSATTVLQRVELEESRTKILRQLRMTICRIREQLIEEGRRRKFLYEEEFTAAQKGVKIIREENNQSIERSNNLRVIDALVRLEMHTSEQLRDAKVAEAIEDLEGVEVGGSHGQIYLEEKKWKTVAVNATQRKLIDVRRCLGAAIEARSLAREREARNRDQANPGNATSLPPHADQWLPQAEKVRMLEEIDWVKYHAGQIISSSGGDLRNERLVVERLKGAIEVLKNKLVASEKTRERDVRVTRFTSERAFELLQEKLAEHQRVSHAKEVRYEEAISALSKEINDTRTTLTEEIDGLKVNLQAMESMSTVLRYELSEFHVREDVTRKELERVKDLWRRDLDTLKVQLRSERNHTARLELWIAAMHDDVRYYLKEIKLREDRLLEQRKQSEAAQLALKYERWKQTTAIYALGTDVDALFLFFMQRIVNLAGSGRVYNDALRANGAMPILTSVAQSPRKDLRRLAARALGSMGWNGYVEQRLLGWDVIRSWKLHTDFVIPREEEKLRIMGKTFEDKVATEGHTEGSSMGEHADGEFKPSPSMSLRSIIRERRQWALRKARRREGPNEENQIMLGSQRNTLKLLLDLCRVKEWDVVRYSCMALSVAAYHEHNNGIMGKTKHCIETMVKLCANSDEEIQTHAAATLANLGYCNEKNQELIGRCSGIEALIDLCRGADVDVIEASTAAVANLVTMHSGNAVRLAECGGVDVLTHLITSNQIVNLLDFDQVSEIQANAAECLANVTRNYGKANAARIHELGISPLVLMCGSQNIQVQRHSALVLGNISQDEDQREVIGLRGGVEALMLLCEKEDEAVRANAVWALGNMAWHPLNQERIGRYMEEIVALCKSDFLPVRVNAICCLANILYFHDRNRERLAEVEDGVEMVIEMCGDEYMEDTWENALRAMVSLTYVDDVGHKLGKEGIIKVLVKRCKCSAGIVQKYAAMALLNLSVHDSLKIRILEEGGVEALAGMQNSESKEAREVALSVLEALADIRSVDELADQKAAFGIQGMLQLVQTDNDLIVKLACESLAEEVWSGGELKQNELVELGGADIIMKVISRKNLGDAILNPALWTIRNLVYDNYANKTVVGKLKGVEALVTVVDECFKGRRVDIVESALTTLTNMVVDHEKNCRMLLKEGLSVLIEVAEAYSAPPPEHATADMSIYLSSVKTNSALATSLLQLVGKYNFLVCGNCGEKQPKGSTCGKCGRAISFATNVAA